jgi:hypothetical protein
VVLQDGWRSAEEGAGVHGGVGLVRTEDIEESACGCSFDAFEVELGQGLEVLQDGVEFGLQTSALLVREA